MEPISDLRESWLARDRILGQPVDAVSLQMAADMVIERALLEDHGAYVCLTNAHSTVESRRDADLRTACESAFLSVPDGMPLVWILRRRGRGHVEKVTGIEYMPLVASAGLDLGVRHFLLGGAPGVAEAAAKGLQARVPGTNIVGVYSPPYGPPETWDLGDLRASLRSERPHIMWVGLGAPKQELWMADVAGDLEVPMMIGVGAAFDFLAGTRRPAPRAMSRVGLEWLFRLLSEPRRLWRRYLIGNSMFLWLLMREAVTGSAIPPDSDVGGRDKTKRGVTL